MCEVCEMGWGFTLGVSNVHHLIMKPDVIDAFVHLSIHPSLLYYFS